MSSKLAAFLKSKKKATPKVTGAGTDGAASTKADALEQWGGDEDDGVVAPGAAGSDLSRSHLAEDSERELTLPSQRAAQNFEWRKANDEKLATEREAAKQAEKEAEEQRQKARSAGGLVFKSRSAAKVDMRDFPTLAPGVSVTGAPAPAAAPSATLHPTASIKKATKTEATKGDAASQGVAAKSADTNATEDIQATEDAKNVERVFSVTELIAIVGKGSIKWPSVAVDDTAVRNRFSKMQLTAC